MDKQVLVVIPYLAKEAQGRELEFAVAGWRKHFTEPHLVVIVGDQHPAVKLPGVCWIPCPRIEHDELDLDNYTPHLDHVHKFRKVREYFPNHEGFIYACDDMYAVKDFDLAAVKAPKIVGKDMGGTITHPNGWVRDKAKTRLLCQVEGWPVWNWVCHLPVYYEWDKLFAVYDTYGCDKNSYIVENIYFNKYEADYCEPMLINGRDGVRCWLTNRQEDQALIDNDFSGCTWCCNTTNGWSEKMERALERHYGL